jgi:hypothetical protein
MITVYKILTYLMEKTSLLVEKLLKDVDINKVDYGYGEIAPFNFTIEFTTGVSFKNQEVKVKSGRIDEGFCITVVIENEIEGIKVDLSLYESYGGNGYIMQKVFYIKHSDRDRPFIEEIRPIETYLESLYADLEVQIMWVLEHNSL